MFEEFVHLITRSIEILGVLVIGLGIIFSTYRFLTRFDEDPYDSFRKRFGRSILLGLEFLVAADIINTVAIKPTFQSVAVLGLIILIRTFLSFSLEVELGGKLPWK